MAYHPLPERPDIVGRYIGFMQAQQQFQQNLERYRAAKQQAAYQSAMDWMQMQQTQQGLDYQAQRIQQNTPEAQAAVVTSKALAALEMKAQDPEVIEALRKMRTENDMALYDAGMIPISDPAEQRRLGLGRNQLELMDTSRAGPEGVSGGISMQDRGLQAPQAVAADILASPYNIESPEAPRGHVAAMRTRMVGEDFEQQRIDVARAAETRLGEGAARDVAREGAITTIDTNDPLYDMMSDIYPKSDDGTLPIPTEDLNSIREAHARFKPQNMLLETRAQQEAAQREDDRFNRRFQAWFRIIQSGKWQKPGTPPAMRRWFVNDEEDRLMTVPEMEVRAMELAAVMAPHEDAEGNLTGAEDVEPQNIDEFERIAAALKASNPERAKTYYDQWVSKFE